MKNVFLVRLVKTMSIKWVEGHQVNESVNHEMGCDVNLKYKSFERRTVKTKCCLWTNSEEEWKQAKKNFLQQYYLKWWCRLKGKITLSLLFRCTFSSRLLGREWKMIRRIFDIVKLATFMLLKLVLFLCLAQGYTKSEKEKLSEYDRSLFLLLTGGWGCRDLFNKSREMHFSANVIFF